MFWQNLCKLCNENQTTPNTVCKALGLSSATATHWRQGSVPRDTTLRLIADYFGITPDDLLRDPKEDSPIIVESTSPLSAEFYDLVDQLTIKELREIQAIMEEKIRSRK